MRHVNDYFGDAFGDASAAFRRNRRATVEEETAILLLLLPFSFAAATLEEEEEWLFPLLLQLFFNTLCGAPIDFFFLFLLRHCLLRRRLLWRFAIGDEAPQLERFYTDPTKHNNSLEIVLTEYKKISNKFYCKKCGPCFFSMFNPRDLKYNTNEKLLT